MLKGPIYAAVKEKKITLFIAAILMLLGFYSYYITPKQESPDINAPVAIIVTVYPGASPEDVERLVTTKIEDKAVEVGGYDSIDSFSKNSVSTVVLWIEKGVDIDKAWEELRQKMRELQSELPKECREIQVNTDLSQTAGMMISISGEKYNYEELSSYAEGLKRELSKVDGISRFDITGKQEQEVSVMVDLAKLNYYNLSLDNIAQIINSQSVEIPSGKIKDKDAKINVNVSGGYSTIKEIENTIIAVSAANGSVVRLKDVASVHMSFEDSNYKIKQNGKNAVLLTGYFKENKNIVITGREVEEKLNQYKSRLPKDVVFHEVLYQPKDVSKAINNFIINLIEGMIFVIIVVFLGMGVRNAVTVSAVIPLSMLITFCVMYLMEIKIHQISIAGLIIALGMLVDNAIVVSDAIQVRIDNDEERMQACVGGVKEVALPVLTSTLTTVGAFIPLLMLPSVAGEYVRSLPQIIMISLSASYFVALFVTPVFAYMTFKKSTYNEKLSKVRGFFNKTLKVAMNNKKRALVIPIIALAFSVFLAVNMGLQFFPMADKKMVYVDIRTEQSTDMSKTESISSKVADILKEQNEIVSYTEAIGNGLPKFFTTLPLYTQSQDFAQIMIKVDLKKGSRFKTNTQFVDYLQGIIDSKISGGTVTVKQLEQGEPIGNPIRIRVSGDNIERIKEAADEVENTLSGIEGTINVGNDFTDRVYEYDVNIDVDKASTFGISKYDVQREVNIALSGKEASVLRKVGSEYKIMVKGSIDSKEELENIGIKSSAAGTKVILKEIAEVSLKSHVPNIKRHERDRSITVFSDVKSGYNSANIEQSLKNQISRKDLSDVSVSFDGEKAKILKYFGDMGVLAIFAGLVIFAILLFQFRNFSQPFVILLTIPLSVIGAIVGLFVTRQPLSFTSMLGIVSLMGIVVNNAIVLLDYINSERSSGVSLEQACEQAADKRFRPIMLTTTTTVVGLVPLIMGGDNLFTPMSISLLSGLMISTLLTLVVIPVVYAVIENKFTNKISSGSVKTGDKSIGI